MMTAERGWEIRAPRNHRVPIFQKYLGNMT